LRVRTALAQSEGMHRCAILAALSACTSPPLEERLPEADKRITDCGGGSGGYEFTDWGGVAHVGGGSHGSLHRVDSLGVLLFAGTGPKEPPPLWRIRDVTPMALEHFAVDS
jgi:hypothetical protein